ncbi:MIF4G domain containing protein [Lotmaria passim]
MERRYQSSCSLPRSRSAPRSGGKSPRTPSSFYAFPSTLQDILYGPRQRLTKYAEGMQALPLPISKEQEEENDEGRKTLGVAAAAGVLVQAEAVDPAAPADAVVKHEEKLTVKERHTMEEMIVPREENNEAAGENNNAAAAAAATVEMVTDETTAQHDQGMQPEQQRERGQAEAKPVEESEAKDASVEDAERNEASMGAEEQKEDASGPEKDEAGAAAEAIGAAQAGPAAEPVEEEKAMEAEQQQQQQQRSTPSTETGKKDTDMTNNDGIAQEEKEKRAEEEEEGVESAELPQLRATAICTAFDATQIETWMAECRHDTAHVPPGVDVFVRNFGQIAAKFNLKIGGVGSAVASPLPAGAGGKKGKRGASFSSSLSSPKGGGGGLSSGSPIELLSRDGGFGGAVAPHSPIGSLGNNSGTGGGGAVGKKSNALEALGDVWEGRQETPISVAQGTLRRRGLFGEVEKKKIHHMVVAVLNKVTTDPEKFREVKNELQRLPIPEANAEQLEKIVDAFFTKAVREQHFSRSYADLIAVLCKVPQGQQIVGDKTQSLEYRLRVALLKRCQSEFVQNVKAESCSTGASSNNNSNKLAEGGNVSSPLTTAIKNAEEAGGETEKERRDRMCGNVHFVCELFLRDVVMGTVISFIFRVCLLGSEFGEFTVPPNYMPTESQVDEAMTAVKTVKERYFVQNAEGRRMLPLVLGQLDYWVQHYPVSRCRFLLMSIVEDLRAMLPAPDFIVPPGVADHAGAPVSSSSSPALPETSLVPFTRGSNSCNNNSTNTSTAVGAAVVARDPRLPASRDVSDSVPGSPSAVTTGFAEGMQSPATSTTVGGQPLPAPRSRQAGNASVSESIGSFAGAVPAEPPSSAVASPLLALSLTLSSRPLLQAVRAEAIAKLMAALSCGQCSAKEVATQLFDQYGNVLPVLAAWIDRCLSVAKEEKSRRQTGAVLVACAELLTAHLAPASPEWAETMTACRDQVREVSIEALQRALESKLYEDLHIFQFWAQLILSDHDRVLYDEELLNEGLELVAYTAPAAQRNYLVEVSKYVNQVLLKPDSLPWHPATEAHNFVRFRPLLVLYSLVPSGGPEEMQEVLDSVLSFADVRQQSLELRLYHAFRNGTPTREVIFEQLRSSPRLTSRDPTFAAEVLSAMLIAELCSDGVALVENNMDLIQITVDGVNRAAREMALVAEVYEVLRYAPNTLPRTAAARVLRKFVFMHILSDETMDRADRFYEAEHEGVIEKAEKEGRVLEPPPPLSSSSSPTSAHVAAALMSGDSVEGASAGDENGAMAAHATTTADFPRITDHNLTEDALSTNASLHSVSGNNNNRSCSQSNNNNNNNGHTAVSGSAEGAVVDFRANTVGTNSVEGIPSSNASSLTEYRSHYTDRPSRGARRGSDAYRNRNDDRNDNGGRRGKRDSSELGSRHSQRQPSPTRSHEDASKRLYRNSYKNRRRSHEGGSELLSSAGESKVVSPQQPPVAHTPSSTYDNSSSLENSRLGSGSMSRYGRGGGHNSHNNSSSHNSSGGSRGGGRGGRGDRGSGGRGSRGGRGGNSSTHRGSGRGSGRGSHDDSRRGNNRYNSRGGGGGSKRD